MRLGFIAAMGGLALLATTVGVVHAVGPCTSTAGGGAVVCTVETKPCTIAEHALYTSKTKVILKIDHLITHVGDIEDCLTTGGSAPLSISATNGKHEYSTTAKPVTGKTWGQVTQCGDIDHSCSYVYNP